MKHLFVVHNPISDLVAEKIISSKLKTFKKKDVIVCTYRGYKTNLKFKAHALPVIKKKTIFVLSWLDVISTKKFLNSINGQFTVYLPTTGFEIFQILINHAYCRYYCYLEEGLASYYSVKEKNKFHSNFMNRHSGFVLKSIKYIYHYLNFGKGIAAYSDFFDVSSPKYQTSYCFSNHCFGEHPNKSLLKISFKNNESLKGIKNVLVLESLVEVGLLKREVYLLSLEWLIKHLLKRGQKIIHFKFHPDQNKSVVSRKTILSLFDKFKQNSKVDFFEIDQGLSLEDIAYNSLDSEFYMIVSSVAIYANICGRKSYSFYRQVLILDSDTDFADYIKTIPSEYFNIVETINES